MEKFERIAALKDRVEYINAGKGVSAFIMAESQALLTCGGMPMSGHSKDSIDTPKVLARI